MTITADITQAAALLGKGGLVAFPTETVYGLGADASNEQAVRRIFEAKQRPYHHPLIVHIANLAMMDQWARDISPKARQIAAHFWPGPLTLILKKQTHVLDVVTGGQETVGIRLPAHPVAQALLTQFASGVVAPSANKFTHVSPTTAAAVREELGEEVDLILEGGACTVGLESTILDMSGDVPTILRPGMISQQMLADFLGQPILSSHKSAIRAPGMHHLHYAPSTQAILQSAKDINPWLITNTQIDTKVAVLIRQDDKAYLSSRQNMQIVAMPNHATDYAHDLYHQLRTVDHADYQYIIIAAVPDDANWDAIRDRILKATAKR